jgi:transcriptional regulator with XRE-family HTH domain
VRKGIEQLDPAGAVRDVGRYIREQRRQAELSLRKLASQAGVSNPYLSQVERGLRQPSAKILKDIAKALRISAETLYVRAGILDQQDQDTDLVGAILRDPHLSERQKQVLVDVYRSFRNDGAPGRSGEPGRTGEAGRSSEAVQPRDSAGGSGGGAKRSPPMNKGTAPRKEHR